MKKSLLLISISAFVFAAFFPSLEKQTNLGVSRSQVKAPCFWLYVTNTSNNADDILAVKLTRNSTGQSQTYSVDPGTHNMTFLGAGAGNFCGTFNIEITVSTGGFNCAVGIRNRLSGVVYACQDGICCADGQVITFPSVPLSNPGSGGSLEWEVFLYNGSC